MYEYSKWEFMLDGDTQDFRSLSEKVGTAYFNIYGGVDHWNDCRNDDFRMTTLYCENETDPATVWQIGHELIKLFNGASLLFRFNYPRASIHRLLYNGEEMSYVPPQGVTALLGPAPFPRTRILDELHRSKGSSPRYPLIHLATEHEDVYMILKYLNLEHGWVTYYKLLEAVESFAKTKQIDLGTDKARRTSFTNTANNFSLSGFDSRHGFKEVVKMNKTSSMTLEQAHEFVFDVTKKYLSKANFNV